MRVCRDCGKSEAPGRKFGKRSAICNPCHYLKYQSGEPGNKDHHRQSKFRRVYGIEHEEFVELARGGCEACGGFTNLVADHVEDPEGRIYNAGKSKRRVGKFRGVLCNNCNVALGLVQEDPWRLIRYLEAKAAEEDSE